MFVEGVIFFFALGILWAYERGIGEGYGCGCVVCAVS